jgi:hypothetical protein
LTRAVAAAVVDGRNVVRVSLEPFNQPPADEVQR